MHLEKYEKDKFQPLDNLYSLFYIYQILKHYLSVKQTNTSNAYQLKWINW